jgi:hypothetical protein
LGGTLDHDCLVANCPVALIQSDDVDSSQVKEEVRREQRAFQLTRCTFADGVVFLQLPRSVVVLGYVAMLCGAWLMIAWLLPVRTFAQYSRYHVRKFGAHSSDDSL